MERKIAKGALESFSRFITTFISVISVSINPEAAEGLIAVFAVVIIYRVAQGGVKVPKLKRKDEDEDEWEYIRVRRRK